MPIIVVFLLGNLVVLMYMMIQVCIKTTLFMSDAVSAFEISFIRSIYNIIVSAILICCSKGNQFK